MSRERHVRHEPTRFHTRSARVSPWRHAHIPPLACVHLPDRPTTNFRPHWSSSRRTANVHGQDRPAPRRSQSVSDRMRPECIKPPPKACRSGRIDRRPHSPSQVIRRSSWHIPHTPASRYRLPRDNPYRTIRNHRSAADCSAPNPRIAPHPSRRFPSRRSRDSDICSGHACIGGCRSCIRQRPSRRTRRASSNRKEARSHRTS